MYMILWKYHVHPDKQKEFERAYSSEGVWAALFQKSPAYLGTDFFQDEVNFLLYFTIDKWKSKQEYETFLQTWREDYETIDKQCEGLTVEESLVSKGEQK